MTVYTKKVTSTIVGQQNDILASIPELDAFISTMVANGKTPSTHEATVNEEGTTSTIVTQRYLLDQASLDEYIAFGTAMDAKYNRTTTQQVVEDVNLEI